MSKSLKISIAGVIALCFFLLIDLSIDRAPFSNQTFLIDFQAFYCAGSVHAAGGNPYHVEPLRSCEHRVVAVPAPLPGYDLAFFSLLAKLPFKAAAVLWESTLGIAFFATVFALTRLTRLEPLVIFTSLLFSDAVASLFLGQLVPLAVAALSVAMLCISRRQFSAAAFCTILSLIEPHVGFGACLSLLIFVPQSRITLLGASVCLFLVSVASHTLVTDLEYVHTVLPSHILSEINNEDQYSLTHLLVMLGVREHIAAALGSLSYVVLLTASFISAKMLDNITNDRVFFVALPPAFILIGGPFVHIHQMAAALPAALLLLARFPAYRFPLSVAIFFLAIPWNNIYLLIHLGLFLVASIMVLSAFLLRAPLRMQALISIITTTSISIACYAFQKQPITPMHFHPNPNALAEETWRMHIDTHHTYNQFLFLLLKIPTWTALLLIAGTTFRIGRDHRRNSFANNEGVRDSGAA